MSTEQENLDAVLAALNAGNARAYSIEDLKKLPALPDDYTEVTVTRRAGAPNRSVGSTGRAGWRITTRQVSTFEDNARALRDRTHQALEFQRLTVAGATTTPIQYEGGEPIGDDDGYSSGLETWIYAT